MDPDRYALVRDLFLAAEELPKDQQLDYLSAKAGDDSSLIDEVLSLLAEHNPESAKIEGESAKLPIHPGAGSGTGGANGLGQSASETASMAGHSSRTLTQPTGLSKPQTDRPAGFKSHADSQRVQDYQSRQKKVGDRGTRAQATQHGSQRTHAAPRFPEEASRKKTTKSPIWQGRVRRHRRFNSGWLWLAAILPTAIVGWWTYSMVTQSLRTAVENELAGVADSVAIAADQLLTDQAQLVESWTRQPVIRQSVAELLDISKQEDAIAKLKSAPQSEQIRNQLQELSNEPEIKFVVWDRSGMIIASWLEDGADIGSSVSPSGAANLNRAMRGESVLFGPEILKSDTEGFVPETSAPVMAEILPVRGENDKVIAAMLIRGFHMFRDFDALFRHASDAGGLDVYAINRHGEMLSNSPRATELAEQFVLEVEPDRIAANFRVSDPQVRLTSSERSSLSRMAQPLTYSAAGATTGLNDSRILAYNNYAGIPVVGAWRWKPNWDIGIIVERDYSSAFATARIVRYGFIALSVLLSITALVAAAQIARRTTMAQMASHPLSRYEVLDELGSGGMGIVYRARHKQLGRDTALKVLRGDRQNRDDRLRFDREAKLAASLSNPHTVTIYDYGRSDEDEAFCVMEFLKGITLYDVVSRSGHQDYGRVLFVLRQICESLGEAHALGLVHRDIKPQNIMISLDASVGDWAVVFDFGLAKPLRPDANAYQTAETIWAGTPMYMAPERYREPNKMDPRSDIYSVGCIAYFLLSARPPFIECDPESLFALVLTEQPISISIHRDETVPQDIVDMVNRCMAKQVDDRFASANELGEHLDQLREKYPWSARDAQRWWKIHGEELD